MKNRTGTFTLLLALALAGAGNAFAAEDSTAPDAAAARCSEATLHGTYLFANDGLALNGNDQIPFANAGATRARGGALPVEYDEAAPLDEVCLVGSTDRSKAWLRPDRRGRGSRRSRAAARASCDGTRSAPACSGHA